MLTRILLAAILAGVLSGVFVTAVQALRVTPLIVEAETYEKVGAVDGTHDHTAAHHGASNEQTGADEKSSIWAPEDGIERNFYTMLANILVGVSFSLILSAGILLTKSSVNFKSGLVWGICGFIAFVLAPNFGLPPELPGMKAADLNERQIWWLVTVVATSAALMIFAFRHQILWLLGGLAVLLAPHLYGAPKNTVRESAVPADLAAQFVVATMVTSFLFWLTLGGLLGWMIERAVAPDDRQSNVV